MIYYNYKDIIKAPRIAVSPQRLYLATFGIAATHVIYFCTTYLACIVSGHSIGSVWQNRGLLPFIFGMELTLPGVLIGWAGIAVSAFSLLLTATVLSRAVYMYLRDNYFYTGRQAIAFAFRRAGALFGVFITFVFLITPFIVGALLMAAVGRIPWFGEILNALATLPYIFSGMVLVFMTICFGLAFFLAPAIIASSEEDGFGAAVQCMHLTWGQPWRLGVYGLMGILLFITGTVAFAFVIKIGLIIYSVLFMPLMHSLAPILDQALYYVQMSVGGLDAIVRDIFGEAGSRLVYLKKEYVALTLGPSAEISAVIIYIFLMLAGYMTVGYGYAIINATLVTGYIIIEKNLSEKNLLRRKDSEISEDSDAFELNLEENTKNLGEADAT